MSSESQPQHRRVVLHPRTAASRQLDRARSYGGFVRGYTVDTSDVLDLMARQRRAALRTISVLLLALFALPALFAFAPEFATARPGSLPPIAWLLLGPVTLGTLMVVAGVSANRAERREREWLERDQLGSQ